jgi:hypothetical protein
MKYLFLAISVKPRKQLNYLHSQSSCKLTQCRQVDVDVEEATISGVLKLLLIRVAIRNTGYYYVAVVCCQFVSLSFSTRYVTLLWLLLKTAGKEYRSRGRAFRSILCVTVPHIAMR